MLYSQVALFIVLTIMLVFLVKYQEKTVLVFSITMLICYLLGWYSKDDLIKNASNSGLATLVFLMLIAVALAKTSILQKLKRLLFGKSERKTLIRIIGISAISSAILNNTAVSAVLINAIKSTKLYFPSRLLLPMSFATIMGGTLTLIGTSTNLIVNSMYISEGHEGFNFFTFTPIGLVVALLGCLVLYFTSLFLPKIKSDNTKDKGYFIEVELQAGSKLEGLSVSGAGIRHLDGLTLKTIIRKDGKRIAQIRATTVLKSEDKLIFVGDISKISILSQIKDLTLHAMSKGFDNVELVEVIVKESSSLRGKSIKAINFPKNFYATVVGIKKANNSLESEISDVKVKAGDMLILATRKSTSNNKKFGKNFYLINEDVELHNILSGWREKLTVIGFILMVGYAVITGESLFNTSFLLLALLLITGCLSLSEIRNSLPIKIWMIVTSSLCIASSMENTGLANVIVNFSADYLQNLEPYVIFAGIFLLTMLLTELITNNAAVAIMFPVASNLAQGVGIDSFPIIMGIAFATSASFLTPYGYQTNLMVFNATSYLWRDFIVVGVPVSIVYITTCILLIPIVYPFN